jgi:hypothetical protein
MHNRVILEDIAGMPIGEIAALPADQLALLAGEAAAALDHARRVMNRLDGALDLKYGARASDARVAGGKATGTVRFRDGDFVVIADLPKRVRWDQQRLAEAVEIIRREWNDDPAQYVRTELKVAEIAYESWPAAIRQLFEPSRTVETGKPSYRIEPAGKEAQ